MKNKEVAAMKHIEIICLAIKGIDAEIKEWRDAAPDTPAGFAMFMQATEEARGKRDCLLLLYQIVTGVPYE